MRCSNKINHRPYFQPTQVAAARKPYICRIAPFLNGFEFEWLDHYCQGEHKVFYRVRGMGQGTELNLQCSTVRIDGLQEYCDYEFYVESEEGLRSNVRLVRTGAVPEGAVVVNYLHPEDEQYIFSGRYLCDPSIIRLNTGRLIASMSLYEAEMPQNLTLLYYSDDNGETWYYMTDILPYFWATLFYFKDVIYILGMHNEYNDLQIACSKDNGNTWSAPVVLIYGASNKSIYGGCHRAPMHVSEYRGRLYTTCEFGSWHIGSHRPAVLSVGVDEDLMVPENWCCTEFLPFEGRWKSETDKQYDTMEGNVVIALDGQLYEYLRWKVGSALRLKIDWNDPEKMLTYDKIIEMPVSNSMFRLIPYKDRYLLVTNRVTEQAMKIKKDCWTYRNVLSLYVSSDLEKWDFVHDIVNEENADAEEVGFQYPAVLLEDDQLLVLVRSGYNGANNCHDANTSLFWKLDLKKIMP